MNPLLILTIFEIFLIVVLLVVLMIYSKNPPVKKRQNVRKDLKEIKDQINS